MDISHQLVQLQLFFLSYRYLVLYPLDYWLWFIIFAFTFTEMVLLTLPFAINIALSTLLRIAFP
jgi:hypothetical protein